MASETGDLGRCTWLTAEAVRIEDQAKELDGRGSTAEAMLHYRRAQVKFTEAAACCPQGHPDQAALQDHAQDISLRLVYLESLNGAASSLGAEDHIEPLALQHLDLASAVEPQGEREISALVAGSGVSGDAAELSEQGFQLVAALRDSAEMARFIARLLEADGRGVCGEGGSEALEAFCRRCLCADGGEEHGVSSLAAAKEHLVSASWVAPLDRKDKLEVAVAFEKQARELESRGMVQDAVRRYSDAIRFFQHVLKYDDRGKNPKIAEMVAKRVSDLEVSVARLKLAA